MVYRQQVDCSNVTTLPLTTTTTTNADNINNNCNVSLLLDREKHLHEHVCKAVASSVAIFSWYCTPPLNVLKIDSVAMSLC